MELKQITFEQYEIMVQDVRKIDFLQSPYQAKKMQDSGWDLEFYALYDHDECKALSMVALMPLMKFFRYAYIPRGMLIDFHDREILRSFINQLKRCLKSKNVIYLEIDPKVPYQERDKDGAIVSNGWNNFDVVKTLKDVGFLQLPLTKGIDFNKQCRWMSVLDLRNKSKEEIFNSFSHHNQKNIRLSEKLNIKVRELHEDELYILDAMEQGTSKRQDFEPMPLSYYQDLYKYFGKDRVKTLYAYLDVDEYTKNIQEELRKCNSDLKDIHVLLEKYGESPKRQKRLKTVQNNYDSLSLKLDEIQEYRKKGLDELPLACCLFMLYGQEVMYLIGASNYKYRAYRGPFALHWKMIQTAIEEKYDFYNFYGISGYFNKGEDGYGVFDFKRGFNATVVELIGNYILPVKPLMFSIYNKMKKVIS